MRSPAVPTLALLALPLAACGGDDTGLDDAHEAIESYGGYATTGYADSLAAAEELRDALTAFVDAPSQSTLDDAREAWLEARIPYRPTEALRFYGGPIDDPDDEREGQINAWPLDEATIDYVMGNAAAGVINDPQGFPDVTADAILAENFANGEADVKTGYHAIEFLLWGQDLATDGPGDRPFTDYTTAEHAERRGAYLLAVADILVDDLTHVHAQWTGDYHEELHDVTPEEGLRRIMTGIGTLAAAELSGERMLVAYENKDQEDEHSCFSDTTHLDIRGNAQGIVEVYESGLGDLVASRDAALAATIDGLMDDMMTAVEAIPEPFDQAILGDDDDEGRVAVLAAVRAIQDVGDGIVDVAALLDIEINTEL